MRTGFKTKEERDNFIKVLERTGATITGLKDYPEIPTYTIEYSLKKWKSGD